jgi:hypothetical protein
VEGIEGRVADVVDIDFLNTAVVVAVAVAVVVVGIDLDMAAAVEIGMDSAAVEAVVDTAADFVVDPSFAEAGTVRRFVFF